MAIGCGRGAAGVEKVRHGSVLLYQIRREGMRLSECFLEGPENSTLGMLGKPDDRMRLGP
jgi:hypothetical protein